MPVKPDRGSIFVVALFAWAVLPAAAQNLLNARTQISVQLQTETSPLAMQLGSALQVAVILVALVVGGFSLRRFRGGFALIIYLLPWVAMTIATAYMEHRISYTSVIYPVAGVVAGSLDDPKRVLRTIGSLASLLAISSLVLAVAMPGAALMEQSPGVDKGIISSQLLVGPLYHPNQLGESLALGLPFVAFIVRRRWRWMGYTVVAVALLWSGSRTSLVAAGVGVLATILWLSIRKYGKKAAFSPLGLYILNVSVFITGALVVITSNAESFTGRGLIWAGSLDQWATSPMLGKGVQIFAELAEIQNDVGSGAFHAHNMYVHFLITCGLVGLAGLVLLYLVALGRGSSLGRAGIIAPSVWVFVFITVGWLEVPTDLFTPGTEVWAIWIPLAVVTMGKSAFDTSCARSNVGNRDTGSVSVIMIGAIDHEIDRESSNARR
ncbi:O-antigen ligase family protein [Sinomonas gamaensis]|uniref:O-antigen ligase family protein n=1 Tax=Sinomonas gamaensis TaxID=2565624 RepID=UPI001487300B|nr:O-antigen ligase family protein [Sinomonas gamaensis]